MYCKQRTSFKPPYFARQSFRRLTIPTMTRTAQIGTKKAARTTACNASRKKRDARGKDTIYLVQMYSLKDLSSTKTQKAYFRKENSTDTGDTQIVGFKKNKCLCFLVRKYTMQFFSSMYLCPNLFFFIMILFYYSTTSISQPSGT